MYFPEMNRDYNKTMNTNRILSPKLTMIGNTNEYYTLRSLKCEITTDCPLPLFAKEKIRRKANMDTSEPEMVFRRIYWLCPLGQSDHKDDDAGMRH